MHIWSRNHNLKYGMLHQWSLINITIYIVYTVVTKSEHRWYMLTITLLTRGQIVKYFGRNKLDSAANWFQLNCLIRCHSQQAVTMGTGKPLLSLHMLPTWGCWWWFQLQGLFFWASKVNSANRICTREGSFNQSYPYSLKRIDTQCPICYNNALS